MKRVLPFLCALLLVSAVLVVPVLGAELAGGYYITCDCALGNGMTFYVPAEFAGGSLTYDSSGNLFNLTASSIYLYSPDYPEYTIYAPRFSGFQYRAGSSGYSYVDLNITNVTDTNVEILDENPTNFSSEPVLVAILAVLIVGVGVFILNPR